MQKYAVHIQCIFVMCWQLCTSTHGSARAIHTLVPRITVCHTWIAEVPGDPKGAAANAMIHIVRHIINHILVCTV